MNWDELLAWNGGFLLADILGIHPQSCPEMAYKGAHVPPSLEPGFLPCIHHRFVWYGQTNCTDHWGASPLAAGSWENTVLWIQQCQRKRLSETQNVLVPRTFQLWVVLQWNWNQRKASLGSYSSHLPQTPAKLPPGSFGVTRLGFWLTKIYHLEEFFFNLHPFTCISSREIF
jgi:hypothetical protein